MSVLCGKCHNHHEDVTAVKDCYGLLRPVVQPVRPFDNHSALEPVTAKQLNYIEVLGGDLNYARQCDKQSASTYIKRLQEKGGRPVSQSIQSNPKLDMLNTLIESLPDGRYAIREDESVEFVFLRVKRHTRGKLAGCLTIQTQHSERLDRAGIRWSAGWWNWSKPWVIDKMLLVCVDPKQAAYNYAKALNRCGICGKLLTDERSRWYGIGPDCETGHFSHIEWVDDQHDGKSYEQLRFVERVAF